MTSLLQPALSAAKQLPNEEGSMAAFRTETYSWAPEQRVKTFV